MHIPRVVLAFLFCFALSNISHAQYTETINSNRPGQSQGAYAVGNKVIQLEVGYDFGSDEHSLLNTKTDIWGIDFAARYGFLKEQLELNVLGRYQNNTINFQTGTVAPDQFGDFETLTLGAKYLFFDPGKNQEEEVNLYSYWANKKFKWNNLIPSIAFYAGVNFGAKDNPFLNTQLVRADLNNVTPTAAFITQNNWGPWVWVNNILAERLTSDFPSYTWITTMTHSFNPHIAAFLEYQLISSDLYADNIIRFGGAYLFTQNFSIDAAVLLNTKDTPKRQNIAFGLSYRLDFHDTDEKIIIEEGVQKESKMDKKMKKKAKKKAKKNKRKDLPDFEDDGN